MAQLVEMTGVPKSTILYYIKEGLLPQPEKIKQNVCLYDPEYVERIKFLKFFQNNYGKSIAELKAAVCTHGYDFSKGSDILIDFLEKLYIYWIMLKSWVIIEFDSNKDYNNQGINLSYF